MKRYAKPEEYIRRLEESNEDLRKQLREYKYNEAVNYELEEENHLLKILLKLFIYQWKGKYVSKIIANGEEIYLKNINISELKDFILPY